MKSHAAVFCAEELYFPFLVFNFIDIKTCSLFTKQLMDYRSLVYTVFICVSTLTWNTSDENEQSFSMLYSLLLINQAWGGALFCKMVIEWGRS